VSVTTGVTIAPTTTAKPTTNPCASIDFLNRTYDLPDTEGPVAVTNGQGTRGAFGASDYVALQIRGVEYNDIGGSSPEPEIAIFTNVNTGGTGQFTDVHIFTCSGSTVSRITSAGSGDRADGGIRSMKISGGKLVIDRNSAAEGACCPKETTRQAFTLNGTKLAPSGPAAKRLIVSLSNGSGGGEVPVTFLPGTTGAVLFGDTGDAGPGGFDASAGQKVTVSVDAPPAGLPAAVADVVQGATVLVSVTAGTTGSATLPATGHYAVRFRPAVTGAGGSFDAELTIT
jgi:hypothetical protein